MTLSLRRLGALAAATVLMPAALAGCAKDAPAPAATGASSGSAPAVALIQPGTLKMCTHAGFRPFEFGQEGKIVGYDIDVSRLVAERLGVKFEVIDIDFGQITSGAAFAAKKCDMAAAAITVNDKRKAALGISDPYFAAKQALLVKKDSPIKDLTAMKGKVLGVQTDTTGLEYAEKQTGQYGYTTKVFEDSASLANAVLSGSVDAALNDSGVMLNFAKDNAGSTVVTQIDTQEHYAMATAKDNTALLGTINAVLKDSKANGALDKVETTWFGTKLS